MVQNASGFGFHYVNGNPEWNLTTNVNTLGCWVRCYKSVADPGSFPGGAQTPKSAIIFQKFPENCMKMKEFRSPGGGHASLVPPLDLPIQILNSQ